MVGMDAERLREWLVRQLEPVCDADPEVLSKYVLALVTPDPQEPGLEATCVQKLDEFLGDETRGFVAKLFAALASGSYKRQDGGESEGAAAVTAAVEDKPEASRRPSRPRSPSEDEDDRRSSKRRRDDGGRERERERDGRYEGRRSPRRESSSSNGSSNRRQVFNPRDGPMMGYGRRNFAGGPPEWGMPPPQHMWPPHFAPNGPGGFPHMPPDFDPNVYNPDNPAMGPGPMGMMMPMGGRGQFYPGRGGRGQGRGRGGFFPGGRGPNGEQGGHPEGDFNQPVAKTTLRVSNVDPKYVNMTKLSLHFSKFGNMVNVQMRPNHKCAYVQYATEEEAKKAFHSPIPVCNNRFIEVKWAKYDAKDPQGAPPRAEQDAAESKASDEENAPKATTDDAVDPEAAAEAEAAKQMTPEELRAAALEKGRKVLEEKRELLEKQRQLKKQKEELIKRQLAQQKEMLERMSRNSGQFSTADKRDLLNKITALSTELKTLTSSHRPAAEPAAGDNINGLKAELSALEAEASGSGGRGAYGRGFRGGRGYRGRGGPGRGRGGRGGFSNTLDNRTTIVRVANLPEEARDPMVLEQHFGHFGAIERVVLGDDGGFIKFQDRYGGQAALAHGKTFGESTLELGWAEPSEAPSALASADAAAPASAAESAPPASSETAE